MPQFIRRRADRAHNESHLAAGTPPLTVKAMPPFETTDARFTADVLESDAPVVVDFHAVWCGPCRMMSPILAELADERPDVRFVKLDTDLNQETAVRYQVLSMPTLMVFRAGEPVLRLVGARRKSRLQAELEGVL